MRTQMCLTGFALATQAARLQQIGGTSEQPNATTNLDDLELSQTTTTVEDWTPAEDVYDFDSIYAELWATPDDSDLEYTSSGWSLAQAGAQADDPFWKQVYKQAEGLRTSVETAATENPDMDLSKVFAGTLTTKALSEIGIKNVKLEDVSSFVDGLFTAAGKKTWKEVFCGLAISSKGLPVIGKFLTVGSNIASLAKKKMGGAATDNDACRKKWNFKKFNFWKKVREMMANGYDFGVENVRMMTDQAIGTAGSVAGGLAFMVGGSASGTKAKVEKGITSVKDNLKKIGTGAMNMTSSGLNYLGFTKTAKKVDNFKEFSNNAGRGYLNDDEPVPTDRKSILQKFRSSFQDCSKGDHDFLGVICIRDGCPAGFESCGPFCATEKYCGEMMNGALSDMLGLTIQVGTILASGGLALSNPMTIVSLVGGVTGAMDKLYHPSCDEREAYLKKPVVDEEVDSDTQSWREWIVEVLGACDDYEDDSPAEALKPVRKALEDLEKKFDFVEK